MAASDGRELLPGRLAGRVVLLAPRRGGDRAANLYTLLACKDEYAGARLGADAGWDAGSGTGSGAG